MKFSAYESDFTQFLKSLKQTNPQLESQQQEGRSRLWDKEPIDMDTHQRNKDSRIKQRGYVYQGYFYES